MLFRSKIVCKLLAIRLGPELKNLISSNQSAFVKTRSIQDNFLYVKNVIKEAHGKKKPLLFLKLDIAKAFDSVHWSYILEVLKGFGFGQRWCDIVSLILATSSSRVLLNGTPGKKFLHKRGLRQGDPLSPLFFILMMEPLQKILLKATEVGLLSPLGLKGAKFRASFYADDAALFLNPVKEDMVATQRILHIFGCMSGLKANLSKCVVYPIQCRDMDITQVLNEFGGSAGSFPCQYLGLPLGIRRPSRADLQKLIDRIASKLKPWKGKLMTRTGRMTLINSVLTSTLTYFLTSFYLTPWAIKKIDKIRRSFLWKGDEDAKGGHCLVNWKAVCTPKKYGGLGVKNLCMYGRALRLRWPWYAWDDNERPWKGMALPCDGKDMQLFAACTNITIGDGKKARFWQDKWLNGNAPAAVAPLLFRLTRRKSFTVAEALHNGRWLRGISRISCEEELHQFLQLWGMLDEVQLTEEPDTIRWLPCTNGIYTARSAYECQFWGQIQQPHLEKVWHAKVEGKIKFFIWLLLQNRNWTADRLTSRGLTCNPVCSLCEQEHETAAHLTVGCSYVKEVWFLFTNANALMSTLSSQSSSVRAWWHKMNHGVPKAHRNATVQLACYIVWHIWKERGRRIFEGKEMTAADLVLQVREDLSLVTAAVL